MLPVRQTHNRALYEQVLDEWCGRSKHFSLILLDIDHFKKINDTYSHAIGDEVLKEMAHIINDIKRDYDIFARIGGEEFALLTPRTDLAIAADIASRIRLAIESATMTKQIKITISVGISRFRPDDDTAQTVFERADQSLYNSKRRGRNRITLETDEFLAETA